MQAQEKLAQKLEDIVLARLAENTLTLPPPPLAVTRCLALVRTPDFALRDSVPIIESDPVVAARVLKAANSAAHGGMERAKSIAQAVTRIGVERLKAILMEIAAQRLFESRDPRIQEACRGVWEHSLAVAMLSRDVAALTGVEDTECAYLAGLLHDVGKPVVAWALLEAEKLVVGTRTNIWIDAALWVEAIQRSHRKAGVQLAAKWGLPEAIASAIADSAEYDSLNRLSPGNCVRFANALAKREGLYVGEIDADDVDALVMIGRSLLGMDDVVMQRLCSGLQERVKAQLN